MKISITNCTGTRNRGVEALVQCLVHGLRSSNFQSRLSISLHTNDPFFDSKTISGIEHIYFSYPLFTPEHFRAAFVNKSIYRLSSLIERILPSRFRDISSHSLIAASNSDFVLPTGGDLFTSDYHKLRKQFTYSSIASNSVLLGHTVGPFTRNDEKYFIENIKNFRGIALRDSESFDYVHSLGLGIPLCQCADLAFCLEPPPKEYCRQLVKNFVPNLDDPIVGLAVSQGIIYFADIDSNSYYNSLAQFIDELHAKNRRTLLIPHVLDKFPNNNDWYACYEVWKRVRNKNRCSIAAGEYTASEFKGMIGLCECLIGTRMHPTIASISQGIPSVAIGYSRKAGGLFADVFGTSKAKSLVIDIKRLNSAVLMEAYKASLEIPIFKQSIKEMRNKANKNFSFFQEIANDTY
jgi:colanic acid/amylovoran biosynthesis protein